MHPGYRRIREELVAEGVLADENDQQYRLSRTFTSTAPPAPPVCCPGQQERPDGWRDERGRTIKDNEEATAASPA
ncbi:hypothetical protein LT493_22580 [Streptomyces tricolor]|nr:hypothetical protein [Streptomyces tricolor]